MDEPHVASELSEQRRVEYLIAVAAVVFADREVAETELSALHRLATVLALPERRWNEVEKAARAPDLSQVHAIVYSFRTDPARFGLLTDAILVAFADRRVAVGEPELLAGFATTLGIPTSQAVLLGRHVERSLSADDDAMDEELSKALASGLAAAFRRSFSASNIRGLYRKLALR